MIAFAAVVDLGWTGVQKKRNGLEALRRLFNEITRTVWDTRRDKYDTQKLLHNRAQSWCSFVGSDCSGDAATRPVASVRC